MKKESVNWNCYYTNFEFNTEIPIASSPWGGHSFFAYDLVRNIQPSIIVELGTYTGNSLFAFAQAIKDGELKTELHGIDTWEGDKHAGFYGEELYMAFLGVKDKYYQSVNIIPHKMYFDEALKQFEDNSIDILHIDGLHTYEAVKHDFETWLPKVNKDHGIILFHDVREKRIDFGVYKLWEEIQKEYKTFTLKHYHGLGIVFMKDRLSEKYLNEHLIRYYNDRGNELFSSFTDKLRLQEEMKYKIYRLCRNEETIQKLVKEENLYKLPESEYVTGIDLYQFINNIIENCEDDYALLLHDDVIVPININERVERCIKESNEYLGNNNWAVIGNAGIEILTKNVLHHLIDPDIHIIIPRTEHPQIVESVDGNTMLINLKNIRERAISLPKDLSGFHLYDIILCAESAKKGLVCAVSSQLYVKHLSGGNKKKFVEVSKEEQFLNYFKQNFGNKVITTINGNIITNADSKSNKKRLEDIVDKNVFTIFKDKSFDLHLVINITSESNNVFLLLDSIRKFRKELNPKIKLYIHLKNNNDSVLKEIKNKFPDLQIDIENFPKNNKVAKNKTKDERAFVYVLDSDSSLVSGFAKYLQYFLSNSKIIVGDTILIKKGNKSSSKSIAHIEASNVNKIYSGIDRLPFASAIYHLPLYKKVTNKTNFIEANLKDYAFLFCSLKYEECKDYPIPFVKVPYKSNKSSIDYDYRKTTLMADLIDLNIMPRSFYKFYLNREIQLLEVIESSKAEFEGFKNGYIWKILKKYREIKRFFRNK